MKPKFKVILIQLPQPQFKIQKQWGNSPLAAGYLKAAAFTAGLLDEIDIEILNDDDTNLSGDARLIDLIVSRSPDVVGWSLFLWNARRSLYLSSEIKKRCPSIRILVGGPEVSPETHYVLQHPSVDFGCFGEGETVFVNMLKSIFFGKPDPADLPGSFYRSNQALHINSGKNYVENPNHTPSPFLLNYIDVKNHGIISYEISRGCPFQCIYCQTATLPFRHFSVERICSDIQYFIKERVKQVRFTDSNVALHPDFVCLFNEIKEINSEHEIQFSGFSYAEHLTEEKVRLLKKCNFTFMEIGLQTIHQETLKILHRTRLNRDAFIKGLKLLEKHEITYHVDTIIGLPGESYHDYKATIDFLNDHTVDYIEAFPLMVMPGTRLKAMAESLGLKYQKAPPYYLIETDAISREDIINAKGKYPRVPTQPSDVDYTFLSQLNGSIFDINVSDQKKISSFTEIHGFNKLIIDMKGDDRGDKDYLKNVRNMLHENKMWRNINSPFTAWFKIQSPEQDFLLIKSYLERIVSANPFILMNLIIETDQPFLPKQMDELTDSLHFQEFRLGLVSTEKKLLNHYLLLPWSVLQMQDKEMQEQLKNSNRVVWSVDISRKIKWDAEINLIHQMVNDPNILFRFENGCEKEIVFKVLRYLNRHKYEKSYFTNSALYYAMELVYMENTTISPASTSIMQSPVPYEQTITYECGGQNWMQTVDQPIKHVKDVSFQVALRKKFPHELTEPHDK